MIRAESSKGWRNIFVEFKVCDWGLNIGIVIFSATVPTIFPLNMMGITKQIIIGWGMV